jgi:glycosyltransferase involved in cell wall biosynthesis
MVSGDWSPAVGKKSTVFYMFEEFSRYWDRVSVICPAKEGAKEKVIHENVYFYPVRSTLFFKTYYTYRKGVKILGERRHHLISIHESPPFQDGVAGFMLSKKFRIPYVIEIHHIVGYPRAANMLEHLKKTFTALFFRFDAKNAIAVRTVNSIEVPEFLSIHGVPPTKILFIPSFYIDHETFKPMKLSKEYDIIYCGRLARNKGLKELLEALQIVKEEYPMFKAVVVGSGSLRKWFFREMSKRNLANNIEIVDWLPDKERLAEMYNKSKILVMTSYNEGGPRVTLEAMACGTPVITTKVGIMREVIRDGRNGIFISWEPKDIAAKIITLLEDQELRKKIAENGRKAVSKFEFKKMIRNYAKAYLTIAEERT